MPFHWSGDHPGAVSARVRAVVVTALIVPLARYPAALQVRNCF
jgi:hypothetical protein